MLDTHLIIGQVLKPQGVRGEVKVRPITCDFERFEGLDRLYLKKEQGFEAHTVRVTRVEPDAVYMFFEGVTDRDAAERLRDQLLYIDREHAVALPEDANFICDLIGCEGVDDRGQSLGTLCDVMQPGGNDVYVFRGPRGEVLVPALKSVVLSADVAQKRMLLSAERLAEVAVFEE